MYILSIGYYWGPSEKLRAFLICQTTSMIWFAQMVDMVTHNWMGSLSWTGWWWLVGSCIVLNSKFFSMGWLKSGRYNGYINEGYFSRIHSRLWDPKLWTRIYLRQFRWAGLSFSAPDPWAETGTFLGRIGAGGPKGAYAPGLWFVANVEWSDGSGYCMGSPTAKGNDYEVRILWKG